MSHRARHKTRSFVLADERHWIQILRCWTCLHQTDGTSELSITFSLLSAHQSQSSSTRCDGLCDVNNSLLLKKINNTACLLLVFVKSPPVTQQCIVSYLLPCVRRSAAGARVWWQNEDVLVDSWGLFPRAPLLKILDTLIRESLCFRFHKASPAYRWLSYYGNMFHGHLGAHTTC